MNKMIFAMVVDKQRPVVPSYYRLLSFKIIEKPCVMFAQRCTATYALCIEFKFKYVRIVPPPRLVNGRT